MGKRELYTVGGNVNWYRYYGKQYRGFSKKTKNFHLTKQFHFWVHS